MVGWPRPNGGYSGLKEEIEGVVEVYPYEYDEVNGVDTSLQKILMRLRGKKVRITIEEVKE